MLTAVNFHYIRPQFNFLYPSIFGKTPAEFERQLGILANLGDFVNASQIEDAIAQGKPLPEKAIIITFDDGLQEQYDLAYPILERLGIPAIFFVNTANLVEHKVQNVHKIHLIRSMVSPVEISESIQEVFRAKFDTLDMQDAEAKAIQHYKYDDKDSAVLKYLMNFVLSAAELDTWIEKKFKDVFGDDEASISRELYMGADEVKDLYKRGMLGSHAHTHVPVGQLQEPAKANEIRISQEVISSITGGPVGAFSFPYGSLSSAQGTMAHLKDAGFRFAFTMERAMNHHLDEPFALSRFDNNDMPGGKAYKHADHDFYKYYPTKSWSF